MGASCSPCRKDPSLPHVLFPASSSLKMSRSIAPDV
jgi:hypothetical protein